MMSRATAGVADAELGIEAIRLSPQPGDMGAIIVFDAGDNELSQGSRTKIGGVQVIFSPAGQSADKVIEKLAWDARARGIETMVVSSDAAIQNTVFGGGVDEPFHFRHLLILRQGRWLEFTVNPLLGCGFICPGLSGEGACDGDC